MLRSLARGALDALSVVLAAVVVGVLLSGGFRASLGPLEISSHGPLRPLILLAAVLVARLVVDDGSGPGWLLRAPRRGLRAYDAAARRIGATRTARVAAVAVVLLLAAGTLELAALPTPDRGLVGRYWLNAGQAGPPKMQYLDRAVDLRRWTRHWPETDSHYSIVWSGVLDAPSAGTHRFRLRASDPAELRIDGKRLLSLRGSDATTAVDGELELGEGFHAIEIRFARPDRRCEGDCERPDAEIEVRFAPPGESFRPLGHGLLFAKPPGSEREVRAYWLRTLLLPIALAAWLLVGTLFIWRSWPLRTGDEPLRVGRLLGKLAIALVLYGLVTNLMVSMWAAKDHTTLFYTRVILTQPTHGNGDSWMHLWDALEYFREDPHRSFADRFFKQQVKFIYPPTSLLLFEPLGRVPWPGLVAALGGPEGLPARSTFVGVMNLITWLSLLATLPLVASIARIALERHARAAPLDRRQRLALLGLALGFSAIYYPISLSYQLGQVQTWLYVWFVVALWAWMTGRERLSGALVALIGLVKPQLGLLLIWALLRRRWRFVTGVVVVALPFGLASLAIYGFANHLEYLQVLGFLSKHGESYFLNHSVTALLHRVLFNGPWNLHMHWNLYPPYDPIVDWGTKLTTFGLLGTSIFWRRREHERAPEIDLMIATLSFTMASPIAWVHHYAFILPMYAVVLARVLGAPGPRTARIAWLAASFALTTNYLSIVEALAATRFNVLQSYVLFGAVLLLVLLYRVRHDARPEPGEAGG